MKHGWWKKVKQWLIFDFVKKSIEMLTFKKIYTEQTRFTYKPLNHKCYNV